MIIQVEDAADLGHSPQKERAVEVLRLDREFWTCDMRPRPAIQWVSLHSESNATKCTPNSGEGIYH